MHYVRGHEREIQGPWVFKEGREQTAGWRTPPRRCHMCSIKGGKILVSRNAREPWAEVFSDPKDGRVLKER